MTEAGFRVRPGMTRVGGRFFDSQVHSVGMTGGVGLDSGSGPE